MDAALPLRRFIGQIEKAAGPTSRLSAGTSATFWQTGMVLKAARELLDQAGRPDLAATVNHLMEQMADSERGHPDRLVPPKHTDGPPLHAVAVARDQARAAKMLDLIMAVPKPPKLDDAARVVWSARADWTGVFNTPEAIIELRRKARQGKAPADVQRLWKMALPEGFGPGRRHQLAALRDLLADGRGL
jgi:hypothetical protein